MTSWVHNIVIAVVAIILLQLTLSNTLHAQVSKPLDYRLTTLFGGPNGDGVKATNVGMDKPKGIYVDQRNGDVYYADPQNHQVRYFDRNGISHLFAGSPTYLTSSNYTGLTFANDTLDTPYGVALNSKGEVFISEYHSQRVRKVFYNSITGSFNMVVIAGGGSSMEDGVSALTAKLENPSFLAVSPQDELYICDNYMIRKVVNDTIFHVVGTGVSGFSPDGTLAVNAQISVPGGIAFHPQTGEMYFSDAFQSVVKYVANNGTLYTLTYISFPRGLDFDSNGDLYITSGNSVYKVVITSKAITRLANNIELAEFGGDGGNALNATLNRPSSLAHYGGILYISDSDNNRIRSINLTTNIISTVAGDGSKMYLGALSGYRSDISLHQPQSTYYNSQTDELLVVDTGHNRVLRLNSLSNYTTSLIETIVGTGVSGFDQDGSLGNMTRVFMPYSVTQSESTGDIYVGYYYFVHKLNKINQTITTIAGTNVSYAGDGYPAISAQLSPSGVALAPNGDIFVSDYANHVIRKIDTMGIISTVIGLGPSFGFADGPANSAKFYGPLSIAFIPNNGNLLIADQFNQRIRLWDSKSNNVTTIAGTGAMGFIGDGGFAHSARLRNPTIICYDARSGDTYISDTGNNRIRKITNNTGIISTIAGTGSSVYNGDGQYATSTNITPYGLAIHPITGDLYFSEPNKYLVRRIDSKTGNITTVVGVVGGTTYSKTGLANSTHLGTVGHIAFSPTGDLYIGCMSFNVIKKMDYGSEIVYDVAGQEGSWGVYSGDGVATSTSIGVVAGMGFSPITNELFFADAASIGMIRKISSGMVVTIAGGIGDKGPAVNANFESVSSLALTDTDLYLADQKNYRIRKISLSSGIITSIVGTFSYLDAGDNFANSTNINQVRDVRIVNGNEIVFADTNNFKIRKTHISGSGRVTTIAGSTYSTTVIDNVLATNAYVIYPHSVAHLPNGEMIIAESGSHIIRKVGLDGYISRIAGQFFQSGLNGDVSDAKSALLNDPKGLSVLKDGRIIFVEMGNNKVRMLTPYCTDGYFMAQSSKGTVCNTTSCYGIAYNQNGVCSGKGVCISQDNCTCESGYSGGDCSSQDICSILTNSFVCTSSSVNTTETQINQVSNLTQLDSKTVQFSSTPTITVSLPSIISQHLQNNDVTLKNDSIRIVSSLSTPTTTSSGSSTENSGVVSSIVSLLFLKSSSNEKIPVNNLQQPILLSFSNLSLTIPGVETLNVSCVYLDENDRQWKSDGIETIIQQFIIQDQQDDGNVTLWLDIVCETNHLTSFGVIDLNYKKTNKKNDAVNVLVQDYTVVIAAVVGSVGGVCVIATVITLIVVVICLVVRMKKK